MPETMIKFNAELDTYILAIDGQEIATGTMEELADLSEEFQARANCGLYDSRKDPTKKPKLCKNTDCRKCGWNPEVAQRRSKKLRADRGMSEGV